MPALVYRICGLLSLILARVPVGTNLGLLHLLLALLSGRFLAARGAVFPALDGLGLSPAQVRRSEAALCYGRWHTADLLAGFRRAVAQEGRLTPCEYEGVRPVACDLSAFFRPHLRGPGGQPLDSRHYVSGAGKALPAVVFGLCAGVGRVGGTSPSTGARLGLPRLVLRREAGEREADLQRRLVRQAAQGLDPAEALVVDAGFGLADLLAVPGLRFVARVRSNVSARRSAPPAYKGRGRRPERGEIVRPLARTRAGHTIEATPPDEVASWADGRRRLRAEVWDALVLPGGKPGDPAFRLVALHDPRYRQPLLLVSSLGVSAEALWRLYRDRWAVEQLPLSAKPMLGAERAFVSGEQSRYRLPELALLSGSLLSYVAATGSPAPSGFWDRAARPTCGRLRRSLARVQSEHYAELPVLGGQLRRKNSVTAHLKTGVEAHRRQKMAQAPPEAAHATSFTGN